MSGLYLYALVGAGANPAPPAGAGLDGEPLRQVELGNLAAIVGAMAARPTLTRAALEGHDAVVRRLADRDGGLLPARFGQWAADEGELAGLVEPRRSQLVDALALVDGCVQMTLRFFAVAGQEAGTAPASETPDDVGAGTRYLTGRRLALPSGATSLIARLAPLQRAERVAHSVRPPLLATVHDLVGRADARSYREIVERVAAMPATWRVQLSGPWPAYAFAPEWAR